jgi:hypothetical protein
MILLPLSLSREFWVKGLRTATVFSGTESDQHKSLQGKRAPKASPLPRLAYRATRFGLRRPYAAFAYPATQNWVLIFRLPTQSAAGPEHFQSFANGNDEDK